MRVLLRFVFAAAAALCAVAAPAPAASTAYRLTDLDLRDPHVFVDFLGCRDWTDSQLLGTSFNGDLQTRIQADSTGDGLLDLSLLVVFDPLDQAGAGGPMRFGESTCTAPLAGTTCGPAPFENLLSLVATNAGAGQCLAPIAGTTHGYSPAVISPSGPCFASSEATALTLPLFGAGLPVTLRSIRVAATYFGGPPATVLVNGLLRGFLTEADANATIIPASYPLVGGQPLSVLFPGGDPAGPSQCCAGYSDKDTGPAGEPGWWMYFNFTAQQVPYTGPSVGVESNPGFRLVLASPNPSRGSVAFAYQLEADGQASVTIHDLGGRLVARPASGWQAAGIHSLVWDGRLDGGGRAAPGLYVIRLASASGTIARKVALLR